MLSYLFLGTNDLHAAEKFYDAVLPPLGYARKNFGEQLNYFIPQIPDPHNGPGAIFIAKPFDGQSAVPGNGVMPAFRAVTPQEVDDIYYAGLEAGGKDEGKPGTRDAYGENFYVAYLRDPDGNKVAFFFNDPEDE